MGHKIGVDPVDNASVDIGKWNSVGVLGFLAPPSTQITSAIRQAPSVSVTITVIPDLTRRKTGPDVGAETPLRRSTPTRPLAPIHLYYHRNVSHCCHRTGGLRLRVPVLNMGRVDDPAFLCLLAWRCSEDSQRSFLLLAVASTNVHPT